PDLYFDKSGTCASRQNLRAARALTSPPTASFLPRAIILGSTLTRNCWVGAPLMAGPSSPQHEPTMEEILASIRKIISEDSTEPQPAAPAAASQPTVQAEADVLELTHEIEEVAPAPAPQPAPVLAAAP